MTSHCSGATSFDGDEHFPVHPGKPGGRPVSKVVGCCGNDIGQLQERPSHLLARVAVFRLRARTEGERVQRAGGSFEMTRRQMQVSAGGAQIGMAEK